MRPEAAAWRLGPIVGALLVAGTTHAAADTVVLPTFDVVATTLLDGRPSGRLIRPRSKSSSVRQAGGRLVGLSSGDANQRRLAGRRGLPPHQCLRQLGLQGERV